MNQIIKKLKNITALAFCVPLLFAGGCIMNDESDCPEPVPGDDDKEGVYNVNIRFTVVTRNTMPSGEGKDIQSRAADITGDVEGSGAENYIDLSDVQFFLFDNNHRFLQEFTPAAKVVAESADFSTYIVDAKIKETYFDDNILGTINFYIAVVANGSYSGMSKIAAKPGASLQDWCTASQTTVLTTKPNPFFLMYSLDDDFAGLPMHFPMSGFQRYSVPGDALLTSTEQDPYDLSMQAGKELNLLRALAKIEIIDKININGTFNPATDENGFRIDKAQIDGIMSRGTMFPAYAEWVNANGDETQQVHAPTIPTHPAGGSWYQIPAAFSDNIGVPSDFSAVIDFSEDDYARSLREDKCPVFSGYVYEYSLLTIGKANRPYLRVTTRGNNDPHQPIASKVYKLLLANYTDGITDEAHSLNSLMRNHIYRFEITGISQDVINMNWTVCAMDKPEAVVIPPFE